MSDLHVELDSRNRISLGKVKNRAERYRIMEESDGTLILEPVDMLTRNEQIYLANPQMVAAVQRADEHPELMRPYTRKSPRR
ncbi:MULTISPECIES: hypothetical protein [Rhodococcus]|jgi:hypothetical protein|uniref:hypothetical protein n=1 Tax=Rhodococcus TaxID=1827 RepID=UPI000642524C|nr:MULTISPECIES: hypothetical protein [Rhodococcus]KLN71420.1 hypothetical protein ABM90_12200 [Rhodococcus erythropolis]NHP18605.1 hypothetical protein [Rhodococcus sp. IC4_135]KSU61995.1 hypothetical protein AS032_34000 [Rhodococcus qingshengii]OFE09789.1 hypothetical protein A5N83_05930 [Rhodococcus sp. 1139]SCC70394.1 hypothetical protein GA0061093_14124 [Rhodococcus qingshengii]